MPEIEWEYPTLAPYQAEWINDPHRFKAIEGATGTGKTFVWEPFLFMRAHSPNKRGSEFWWISPTIDQARAVFDNIVRQIEDAGVMAHYGVNVSLREIETPGGGILCFKTGEKPGNLYGIRNVEEIIGDEFTRMRIELWAALLSVANKTGCNITFIGNFTGDDTQWHLWTKTMTAVPEFRYWRTTAIEAVNAGIMPQHMFDTAQATLPEPIFKALYLCEGSSDPSLLVTYAQVSDLWTNDHVLPGAPALTCDIALHGSDAFTMGLWSGMVLEEVTLMTKREPQEVEAIIRGKATEHNVPLSRIVFDADGMGAYLKGYLKGATPYHGGSAMVPQQGQKMAYVNLRSQCHFLAADAIREGRMAWRARAHKEELDREVFACLRHNGQDAALRWGIYPKDHPTMGSKVRLGRSPDRFDLVPMRMYLELTPQPVFAANLQAQVERKRVSYRSRPKHEGNTNFGGR
jgi:hypothetical protein